MQPTKYVIGNWKLNPATRAQAQKLAEELSLQLTGATCQVGVAPTFVHLDLVKSQAKNYWVGAQDLAHKSGETGAFTGDVSAQLLADLGADFVIIGHSERRQYHAEGPEILTQKIAHAQAQNLPVVFCIGETQAQYDAKQTLAVLDEQLSVLAGLQGDVLVAYEPVWAIGTGLTPSLGEIEQVHQHIKNTLSDLGLVAPVLYGGSVNEGNAPEFGASAFIDGALVGGASLKIPSFLSIIKAFS